MSQQDILFIVMNTIKKHGADFAYPTTTLDIPKEVIKAIK